jgi:flagellar motor protein MotB
MKLKNRKWAFTLTAVAALIIVGTHLSRARHQAPKLKSIRQIRAEAGPPRSSDIVTTSASAPLAPRALTSLLASDWKGPGSASSIDGGLRIHLDDTGWFEPGTARITTKGLLAASEVAAAVKKLAEGPGYAVQVEGHSDSAPVVRHRAEYASNWELSGGRAFAIVRVLEAHGFPREHLSGVGYADSRPEGSEARRRLVLIVRAPDRPQEIATR